MRQLTLAIGPDRVPTFDAFVAGANGEALAHLRGFEAGAAPVYLWGPRGAGKTHLLRALGHAWQQRGARVGAWGAADAPPWDWSEGMALLLLDDVDAYDAARQHAAFTLFVLAQEQGVPIAAAGAMPPVDLPLRADLASRLGWGHVFALVPLSEAQVRAELRREAEGRGIFLSDEVMALLLARCPRDLATLMAVLDRIDEAALARQRVVTAPLVRGVLDELMAARQWT